MRANRPCIHFPLSRGGGRGERLGPRWPVAREWLGTRTRTRGPLRQHPGRRGGLAHLGLRPER
eukprot:11077197-Alexandrium_andersonii.AAC.1